MKLSPEDFLIVSAAVSAMVIFVGTRKKRAGPPPEPEKPPEAPSRWRRFLVSANALEAGHVGEKIVTEEPEGLTVPLHDGSTLGRSIALGGEDKRKPFLSIEKSLWTFKAEFVVKVGGRPWLKLKPRSGGNFPELLPARGPVPKGLLRIRDFALQGSLAKREYEIRERGRLAASVTRNVGAQRAVGGYFVEILKDVEPEGLLALVLTLEFAASLQGNPFSRSKG